jgi:hypothetical protein
MKHQLCRTSRAINYGIWRAAVAAGMHLASMLEVRRFG